jgi:integrase/recombinase XerD
LDRTNIAKENHKYLDNYLLWLATYERSDFTLNMYTNRIMMFLDGYTKRLKDVTEADVFGFYNKYKLGKKESTIIHMLIILEGFFKYLVLKKVIEEIPIFYGWFPKLPISTPKALMPPDYARVMLQAEKLVLRDRGMVEFFASSGVRLRELIKLDIGDLNFDKRTALVTGKGNKQRLVPFSEEASFLLKELNYGIDYPRSAVFRSNRGNRISSKRVYEIIRDLGIAAGLKTSLSPHVFRHSFATRLLLHGMDLETLRKILGHEDMDTTLKYTKILDEEIKNWYEKAMG